MRAICSHSAGKPGATLSVERDAGIRRPAAGGARRAGVGQQVAGVDGHLGPGPLGQDRRGQAERAAADHRDLGGAGRHRLPHRDRRPSPRTATSRCRRGRSCAPPGCRRSVSVSSRGPAARNGRRQTVMSNTRSGWRGWGPADGRRRGARALPHRGRLGGPARPGDAAGQAQRAQRGRTADQPASVRKGPGGFAQGALLARPERLSEFVP